MAGKILSEAVVFLAPLPLAVMYSHFTEKVKGKSRLQVCVHLAKHKGLPLRSPKIPALWSVSGRL